MSYSVKRGAAETFIIRVAGVGLAYLLQITLARLLGVDQYGIFTYALSIAFLVAIPCTFGFRTTVVRLLPSFIIENDYSSARGLVFLSIFITLSLSVVLAGAGAIIALYSNADSLNTLLLSMLIVPLLAMSDLFLGILRGLKRMVYSFAPVQIVRPLVMLFCLLVIFYLNINITSRDAMMFMVIAVGSGFLFQAIGFLRSSMTWPENVGRNIEVRAWVNVSLALFLVDSFSEILNRVDIIMLGSMYSEASSGIYNVAARTASLSSFVVGAVNAAAASRISEIFTTDGAGDKLQALVEKMARWIFVLSVLMAVVLLLGGEFILSLFGEEFISAYWPLVILVAGQLVNAFAGSVTVLLNMTGHQRVVAMIYGWCALTNIILNLLLIPQYGIIGAACATLVTTALWNGWMLLIARRKLGINTTIISQWSRNVQET